jgi:hypothetical protein
MIGPRDHGLISDAADDKLSGERRTAASKPADRGTILCLYFLSITSSRLIRFLLFNKSSPEDRKPDQEDVIREQQASVFFHEFRI